MKRRNGTLTFVAAALVAAPLLLNSCASMGLSPSAGPSSTVQGITDDYRQAQLQTGAIEGALDGLAITPRPDLMQAYLYFRANLEMMEQTGTRLIAHADGMFYRGTYYFVESGKSMEACAFPRVARSDDRLNVDLGADFDTISEVGGGDQARLSGVSVRYRSNERLPHQRSESRQRRCGQPDSA